MYSHERRWNAHAWGNLLHICRFEPQLVVTVTVPEPSADWLTSVSWPVIDSSQRGLLLAGRSGKDATSSHAGSMQFLTQLSVCITAGCISIVSTWIPLLVSLFPCLVGLSCVDLKKTGWMSGSLAALWWVCFHLSRSSRSVQTKERWQGDEAISENWNSAMVKWTLVLCMLSVWAVPTHTGGNRIWHHQWWFIDRVNGLVLQAHFTHIFIALIIVIHFLHCKNADEREMACCPHWNRLGVISLILYWNQ